MFSPSLRFIALGAVAFLPALGCGAPTSEICEQYVACVGATSPGILGETLSVYGRDGACWKSLAASSCEQICTDGLTALRKLPMVPSACLAKNPSSPDGQPMNSTDPGRTTQPVFEWTFRSKSEYYAGPLVELPLGEIDPATGEWGCLRDDDNPDPAVSIKRMFEPNDAPAEAISLANPLPVDPPSSTLGSAYEICPDRKAAKRPDYDAFKLRLTVPGRVVAEAIYDVRNGDLDIAIFRTDINPDTGKPTATLIAEDPSALNNACVAPTLGTGTYYAVVRGAAQPDGSPRHATAMNRYRLRVYTTTSFDPKLCDGRH